MHPATADLLLRQTVGAVPAPVRLLLGLALAGRREYEDLATLLAEMAAESGDPSAEDRHSARTYARARLVPGVTLDTGALIAIERADRRMQALLDEVHAAGLPVDIPAGALAQAWRVGPRQARLARTVRLPNVTVPALDEPRAKAAGIRCGQRGTSDARALQDERALPLPHCE